MGYWNMIIEDMQLMIQKILALTSVTSDSLDYLERRAGLQEGV